MEELIFNDNEPELPVLPDNNDDQELDDINALFETEPQAISNGLSSALTTADQRLRDPELETAILSLAICNEDLQVNLFTRLRPDDFDHVERRKIFEICQQMFMDREQIDSHTVQRFIAMKSVPREAKANAKELDNIYGCDTSGYSVDTTVSILKSLTKNRKIKSEILVKAALMFDQNEPTDKIIEHISNVVINVESGRHEKKTEEVTDNVAARLLGEIQVEKGLRIGLTEFDQQFGGIKPDTYYTIGAASGAGKCLAKGTKVIMFNGSMKRVEDIVVGDQLMGPDSTPRNVLALGRGREQMYWVRQQNGLDYRVNESHILSLKRFNRTTKRGEEMYSVENISVLDYLELNDHQKKQRKGYKVGIEFPEQQLPIDPYLFGLWIGDGSKSKPVIHNPDSEILEYVSQWCSENEHECNIHVTPGKTCPAINISTRLRKVGLFRNESLVAVFNSVQEAANQTGLSYQTIRDSVYNLRNGYSGDFRFLTDEVTPLSAILKMMGVHGNKFIPDYYLINSRENRLRLLAGIIDTDGYLSGSQYEVAQKEEVIANAIVFLSRSLGFKTTIKKKMATMKRKDGTVYRCEVSRINIMPRYPNEIPLRVERKIFKGSMQHFEKLNTKISVEKDIVDDYYGFQIDGDSLFLLEDFTVTHNTALVTDFIERLCSQHGDKIKILFFSMEMSEERIIQRLISRKTGMNNHVLEGSMKLLNAEQKAEIRKAQAAIRKYPLEIVYAPMTVASLNLRVRKFALQNPGKRIIVMMDHIGLVIGQSDNMRVNTILSSQAAKGWCVEYGASVFVLSQLTKEVEGQDNQKRHCMPSMNYIMESGRIRQDSDVVLMLWRPEVYTHKMTYRGQEFMTEGKMILLNEKNRDGHAPNHIVLNCDISTNKLEDSNQPV